MEKSKLPRNNLIMIIIATVVLPALLLAGVLGERWWSSQGQLTSQFEECMEQAPFKQSFSQIRPEDVLSPDNLQEHFNEFDQIFLPGYHPFGTVKNSCHGKNIIKNQLLSQEAVTKNWELHNHKNNYAERTGNQYGTQTPQFGSKILEIPIHKALSKAH